MLNPKNSLSQIVFQGKFRKSRFQELRSVCLSNSEKLKDPISKLSVKIYQNRLFSLNIFFKVSLFHLGAFRFSIFNEIEAQKEKIYYTAKVLVTMRGLRSLDLIALYSK